MSAPQYFTGGILYPLSPKNKTYVLIKDIDNSSSVTTTNGGGNGQIEIQKRKTHFGYQDLKRG